MTSQVQRTLKVLREAGWTAQVVEKWIAPAKRRVDLFGFGDIVAIKANRRGARLIQVGWDKDAARHRLGMLENDKVADWLSTGNRVELWSWGKHGPRGKRKLWTPAIEEFIQDHVTGRVGIVRRPVEGLSL